ncbi:MAG: HAMP domain-containing sensor histidine kinase [Phascolarctobacterium sp.]|nr:HAMP domain-containing sensor histidine kinase [Phascolarctobacterium sp.]
MDNFSESLKNSIPSRRSIAFNFMSFSFTVVVVILVAILSGVAILSQQFLYREKEDLLKVRTKEIALSVNYYLAKNDQEGLYRYMVLADKLADADIWIFDTDAELVAVTGFSRIKSNVLKNLYKNNKITNYKVEDTPLIFNIDDKDLGDKLVKIIKDVNGGQYLSGMGYHQYYEDDVMYAAAPYRDAISGRPGTVLLAVPMAHYSGIIHKVYWVIFAVGMICLLLAVYVTKLKSKSIVTPVVKMKDFAVKLALGNYGEQMELHGDSELNDLGKALNTLSTELQTYVANIERHEKVRKDFVANVSHELKTPITIIRGYNDALIDGVIKDEEKKMRYRMLINDETVRIERMVKDLLNMSRLENSDPWEPQKLNPVALTELCRNVAERLGIKCIPNNNTIEVEAGEEIQILGDGDQLLQLILILTDNALKYSPENGKVLIRAYKTDEGVTMSVQDEGPGIPEEDIEFIWDRFYMVDKSRNRKKVPGTGLGLAIAKQIIRIHGAVAHVDSKLGEGTKFEIKFPKDKIV